MSSSLPWLWLVLAVLFLLVPLGAGAWLLWAGWRPRRQGQTPYCAGCGYMLVGNQSGRCPECGRDMAAAGSIVYGERRWRPGLIAAGGFCLLWGMAVLAVVSSVVVRQVNWYQLYPTAWVLRDVESGNAARMTRGWRELQQRRYSGGQFPASVEQRLIRIALREQGGTTSGMACQELVDYLGDRYLAGKLSKEQSDLFFKQAVQLNLTVRPVIVLGDQVPFLLSHAGRGPGQGWWTEEKHLSTKAGDETRLNSGSSRFSGFGGGSTGSSMVVRTPGRHTLESTSEIRIYHGPFGDEKRSRLCHVRQETLKAQFEVVEKAPADYVKVIDDPSLQQQIASCIRVNDLKWEASEFLSAMVDVRQAPINVAFEVLARIGSQEHPLGSLALTKGKQCSFHISRRVGKPQNGTVNIILRSSEAVARQTVDLSDMWKGEIVFEDLKIGEQADR